MFQQSRSSLKNLAGPGVRRLLNHVQQLVAFDSHIEVWADGLSFANAYSHPHVQLRNIERKRRWDRGWNPAIALRYREIRQRFAPLRTAHRELGDLYVRLLARVCRHTLFEPMRRATLWAAYTVLATILAGGGSRGVHRTNDGVSAPN